MMENRIKSKEIIIEAKDGFELKALLYSNENNLPKGIIVCSAGTCIPQVFYSKIAHWLAAQDFDVLTYDYRGVGLSRPRGLKGFKGGISDWARLDMEGIFAWVEKNYKQSPKYLLAHSMGGQIMGLASGIKIFDKIVTVASSYGNYQFYSPKFRKQAAKLRYMIPLLNWYYGYLPSKIGGDSFGEDWSADVAREWLEWGKYKLSFSEIAKMKGWDSYFQEMDMPIRAYFIADDIIATEATIPYYQKDFQSAGLEIHRLNEDLKSKIGHFGFFTGRCELIVWQEMLDWMIL